MTTLETYLGTLLLLILTQTVTSTYPYHYYDYDYYDFLHQKYLFEDGIYDLFHPTFDWFYYYQPPRSYEETYDSVQGNHLGGAPRGVEQQYYQKQQVKQQISASKPRQVESCDEAREDCVAQCSEENMLFQCNKFAWVTSSCVCLDQSSVDKAEKTNGCRQAKLECEQSCQRSVFFSCFNYDNQHHYQSCKCSNSNNFAKNTIKQSIDVHNENRQSASSNETPGGLSPTTILSQKSAGEAENLPISTHDSIRPNLGRDYLDTFDLDSSFDDMATPLIEDDLLQPIFDSQDVSEASEVIDKSLDFLDTDAEQETSSSQFGQLDDNSLNKFLQKTSLNKQEVIISPSAESDDHRLSQETQSAGNNFIYNEKIAASSQETMATKNGFSECQEAKIDCEQVCLNEISDFKCEKVGDSMFQTCECKTKSSNFSSTVVSVVGK